MAVKQDILRCAKCTWTTRKWVTLANGMRKSGWRCLEEHMLLAHDIDVDLVGDPERKQRQSNAANR